MRDQGEQRIVTRAAASDGLHLSVTLLINSSPFGDSTESIDDDGHCTVNVSHMPEIMTPLRQLPSQMLRLYQVYRIVNAGSVLLSDTEHSAPLCDVVEGFEEAFAARSAGVFGACNMLCGEMSSLWTPPGRELDQMELQKIANDPLATRYACCGPLKTLTVVTSGCRSAHSKHPWNRPSPFRSTMLLATTSRTAPTS